MMPDKEKIIKRLNDWITYRRFLGSSIDPTLVQDALALLKEQDKKIKALSLLVEWAEECDFGFDQFRDEYELYKDEIKDMKPIDKMIHVARRTLEDRGAFEEER